MQHNNHPTEGGDSRQKYDPEEIALNDMVNKAVEAAARGENIDQLLELIQTEFPVKMKETIRKRFSGALSKRGLRQPTNAVPDIPSRQTLARLRAAIELTTRQMIDRIMNLLRARPDIAARVKQAGQTLLQNGVAADKVVRMSETELGTISPSATAGRAQAERGRNA